MPVISPERMRDRHDTILAAARRVFAQKGFAAASITDIARAAEVSDGLIYKYFENKRDLLFHVLREFYERVMADLEAVVARGASFRDRLRNLIAQHLTVFIADADLCRLFFAEVRVASDYHGSAIQALNRRYASVMVKLVEQGIAAGEVRDDVDPRLVRDMLFGAIEHLAWRHVTTHRPLDIPRLADELTHIVMAGVAATSPIRSTARARKTAARPAAKSKRGGRP